MLVFTVGLRATPDPRKDTLRNITTAREFVVNIVSEEIGAEDEFLRRRLSAGRG